MKFKSMIYYLFLIALLPILAGSCKKDDSTKAITDTDGNVYHSVIIGTQTWMLENLKTTKYNDGTRIPNIADGPITATLTSPVYCWYENAVANKAAYGALYNWHVVNTGKLCPLGYHVPTKPEWLTLMSYVGGISMAGGKLKETGTLHWTSPNTSADNSNGFTAISGGTGLNGGFFNLGKTGNWWSTTPYADLGGEAMFMYYDKVEAENLWQYKYVWLSVRCIKD